MGIISIIKSLLKSLELFLELKNKSFYYDLEEKHQQRRKELIEEIEDLRSLKNPSSNATMRADVLRQQLKLEDERFERISAAYFKS